MDKPGYDSFKVHHLRTSQVISVFGFAPAIVSGEPIGGDFLVWTPGGWDFVPVPECVPSTDRIEIFEPGVTHG